MAYNIEISEYVDIAARRKWWIIIPFLLILLAGQAYILFTPRVYEGETLIVVQSQKVPEEFVRTIVSSDIEGRLRTITQEVTSRTNLEEIIEEYQLYKGTPLALKIVDEQVEFMRSMINIRVRGGGRTGTSAFTITFRGQNPIKVMQVTNALASNFIKENLKIRETHALGTSSFLNDELNTVELRLQEKEEELKKYRIKYMGGLPEQLNTNLSLLERSQMHLEQLNSNLRDAENRKIILQAQDLDYVGSAVSSGDNLQGVTNIQILKNNLTALESKYTQNHPDVIRLKTQIDKLEAERPRDNEALPEEDLSLSTTDLTLRRQLRNIDLEIKTYKTEIKKVESQIKTYQTMVNETPKREQELLSLQRDYSNLQGVYNSLLNRKLEAEIAVSMEKKQKGEQFRIIDPAKIPSRPVEPNIPKTFILILIVGLCAGGGSAFLKESLDTSYKTAASIENELQLPVLVSLPIQHTKSQLKAIKRKNILIYSATGLAFILSSIGILFAAKGVDKTMELFRNFLTKT